MQSSLDANVSSGLDIELPPLHKAQKEVVENMKRFLLFLVQEGVGVRQN